MNQDQEIPSYEIESIEMNTYSKMDFQNVQEPDPYSIAGEARPALARPAVVAQKNAQKLSFITKLLIVGWIVNLVLIIVIGITLSFFLTRTATKSQVGTISEAIAGGQGLVGSTGPVGEKGDSGQTGPVGETGPHGPVGETGTGQPGVQGIPGPSGASGLKGERGVAGQTGTTGSPGVKGGRGVAGQTGTTGSKGERGVAGQTGTTGSPGVRGDRGLVGPPGSPAAIVGGVSYNRWGRSICRTGVERVYTGRTGVTFAGHTGGAANYVCMPNDPEYILSYRPGVQGHSYVYGAEYEQPLVSGRSQHNAPCAVCYIPTKHTVIMIPAKTSCLSGWTREYYGYLMSENVGNSRTMYECVDIAMQSISGSQNDIEGGHFFHVEAHCNGMACPPYNNEKELACVVCSK